MISLRAKSGTVCYHRGVTLIEILVAISIISLISGLILAPFANFRSQKMLDAALESMLAAFSRAHLDTISSLSSQQYGVHIGTNQMVYFIGPTYATGTATNIIYKINAPVEIVNISLNGGGSDVLFQHLTGSTNQYGTFQMRPIGRPTMVSTVSINATGALSI